jgi:hypothetical protein
VNPILFFVRLFGYILGTLLGLIILMRLVIRLPGFVVGLSAALLVLFGFAWARGGLSAVGIRSRKAAALASIASTILMIVSIAILLNVK